MSRADKIVDELVSLIIVQYEEIKALEQRVERIKQYLEVYEEYIERLDSKWQR